MTSSLLCFSGVDGWGVVVAPLLLATAQLREMANALVDELSNISLIESLHPLKASLGVFLWMWDALLKGISEGRVLVKPPHLLERKTAPHPTPNDWLWQKCTSPLEVSAIGGMCAICVGNASPLCQAVMKDVLPLLLENVTVLVIDTLCLRGCQSLDGFFFLHGHFGDHQAGRDLVIVIHCGLSQHHVFLNVWKVCMVGTLNKSWWVGSLALHRPMS